MIVQSFLEGSVLEKAEWCFESTKSLDVEHRSGDYNHSPWFILA